MEKKTMFMYGTAGLFGLAFILSLTDVFGMSWDGHSAGVSLSNVAGFSLAVFILVNLAGAALTLLPEFNLIPRNPMYKWIIIGLAGAGLLFFLIAWIFPGGEVKTLKEMVKMLGVLGGNGKISFGPSFLGWLLMLCEIGAGALTYLKTKEDEKE